jgi:hypothetical protein
MSDCVLEDIATEFEIGKNLKENEKTSVKPMEAKCGNGSVPSLAPTWEIDQLLMAGIVVAIVILSCTALVYVARH